MQVEFKRSIKWSKFNYGKNENETWYSEDCINKILHVADLLDHHKGCGSCPYGNEELDLCDFKIESCRQHMADLIRETIYEVE